MTEKEALEILCEREEKVGDIDGITVIVTEEDIISNLQSNDYELDLFWVQDLTAYDDEHDFGMFQGHSLSEVVFE